MIFKTPELVSTTEKEADNLRIVFWGEGWFTSQKWNERVNGGPIIGKDNVLIYEIPP
jgi:hypothetical protein